jgi:hypothetical protein
MNSITQNVSGLSTTDFETIIKPVSNLFHQHSDAGIKLHEASGSSQSHPNGPELRVSTWQSGQRSCLENLKVLIVSTPKTGNTWIKFLLAALYHLPLREPTLPLDLTQFAAWGPRWVAHQHLWPSTELLDWLREERVTIITTVRHPADILVSLYHYVRAATDRSNFDVALQALATAPHTRHPSRRRVGGDLCA